MQRLFWRFFLVFWATLLMAIMLVRLTFVWQDDIGVRPPVFSMQPPPDGFQAVFSLGFARAQDAS